MKKICILWFACLLCGCTAQLSSNDQAAIDLFEDLSVSASVSETGDIVRSIEGVENLPGLIVRLECSNVCANGEKAKLIIPNVRDYYKDLPESSKKIILGGQPEFLSSFNDLSKDEQDELLNELLEKIRSKVWYDRAYRSQNKKKALNSIRIEQVGFAYVPAEREGQVLIPAENRLILGLTSDSSFGEEYSYHQVFVFESVIKENGQWKTVFRNAQNGAQIWSDVEFKQIMERPILDDIHGEPVQYQIKEVDDLIFEITDPMKEQNLVG